MHLGTQRRRESRCLEAATRAGSVMIVHNIIPAEMYSKSTYLVAAIICAFMSTVARRFRIVRQDEYF